MDFLDSLNPKQREAVELPNEHALILAGAGSGKTRVLTTRIAWLLSQGRAAPWEILAVTFTNKAAREMKTRLEAMLSADVNSMWVGTFHGIAHRLLRAHAQDVGLPKTFQIIDQSDQLSLIKRIMKEAGINTDDNDPKAFQSAINHAKERGLRASDMSAGDKPGAAQGIYAAYEMRCRREGLVDFAELLLSSLELLEKNQEIREHYAQRFKFILIDEFQDTNALQYRWIKALCAPGSKESAVFCVGDDDQSIYAFRGARVGNMADFVREYGVSHIVKLEQNYRSTSHILDAANAVISFNQDRMGKSLWTSAGKGEPIGLYHAGDDREEAWSIVQEIMNRRRSGARYSDFAVLYRNNSQSRVIEQYLTANSMPYRIYGGLRFFDRQEIKDVTAYLRLLVKPDDVSLQRVINQPPRGIGSATMEKLSQRARAMNVSLWEALTSALQTPGEAAFSRAGHFVQLIETMRKQCEGSGLAKVVSDVIDASGLKNHYSKQPDKDIRLENLSELVSAASNYCQENDIEQEQSALTVAPGGEMSPLDGFIAQAVLESDDKSESTTLDAVQLMTVHASKGLEFDTVFLSGLEKGLFPHPPKEHEDVVRSENEERRLLYVAMTRARKHLRISWCEERMLYGNRRPAGASPFIKEIPDSETVRIRSRFDSMRSTVQSGFGTPRSASDYVRRGIDSRTGGFSGSAGYGSRSRSEESFSRYSQIPRPIKEENPWGLSPGDKVRHAKFGVGTVLRLVNAQSESDATVWIRFGIGNKELMLRIARLEKIS